MDTASNASTSSAAAGTSGLHQIVVVGGGAGGLELATRLGDTLGKRKSKRRTYGYTAGKRTTSFTEEDKYFLEPHELRRLKKFQAVVQHCDYGFRKVTIPALGHDGRVPAWYREAS